MVLVTRLFPANVKSILTSLPWFDITSACPDVVLHTNRLLVLAKLDLAVFRDLDFPFLFAFAFPFGRLVVIVLDNWLILRR